MGSKNLAAAFERRSRNTGEDCHAGAATGTGSFPPDRHGGRLVRLQFPTGSRPRVHGCPSDLGVERANHGRPRRYAALCGGRAGRRPDRCAGVLLQRRRACLLRRPFPGQTGMGSVWHMRIVWPAGT